MKVTYGKGFTFYDPFLVCQSYADIHAQVYYILFTEGSVYFKMAQNGINKCAYSAQKQDLKPDKTLS